MTTDAKIDALSLRLEQGFSEMRGEVTRGFSGLDQRITGLDRKVTAVGGRITRLDKKVVGLDGKISVLNDLVEGLAASTSKEFDEVRGEIRESEGNVKAYVKAQLDSQTGRILDQYDGLTKRVKDLEVASSN